MMIRASFFEAPAPAPTFARFAHSPQLLRSAVAAPPAQSAPVQVMVTGSDPVSGVARLQEHDGSFALDDKLLALLRNTKSNLTLRTLKDSIPSSLRSAGIRGDAAERVWATALAAAYMLVVLRDRRSVWEGLWEKARQYACRETQTASFMFNQLVQEASELLRK
ncbi:hypothetical protein C8Q77DRAFT_748579 [Trametes polyzona]|nr:hypothetical protein C8Q77DRAFT_748579 [Trametes polyzona]